MTFRQDFNTKRPKGYAFVEFFDRRDAQDAIYRLDGYELDGRRIAVSEAKDKRKTPDELRARQGDRRAPPDDRDRRGGSRRSRSRDRQSRGGDSRREGRGDRDGNQQVSL